jgi:type IV pilus assembly protein PilC
VSPLRYRARTSAGTLVVGVIPEGGAAALASQLAECGLRLVDAQERRVVRRGRPLRDAEAASLARDLATVISSGVPIVDGIHDLAEHAPAKRRQLLEAVASDIESGRALADALEARGGRFSLDFISAARAGERSGALDRTLERVAEHLEWRAGIRAGLIPALAYPAGLILAASGLVALVALYLVPKLTGPLQKAGVQLPWITRFVLGAADGVREHGLVLAGAAAALLALLAIARASSRGRLAIDGLLLRIPLAGPLAVKAAGAEFAATLGTLHHAGLPLPESLALIGQSTGNHAIAARIDGVRDEVLAGGSLAEAARRRLQFPPLVARLLAIGERTGSLERSLERITKQLETELRLGMKRFVAIAEPAAILFAGIGIGTAVFAAILPLFRMLEAVRK